MPFPDPYPYTGQSLEAASPNYYDAIVGPAASGAGTGSDSDAFNANLTKALGELAKGTKTQDAGGAAGQGGVGGMGMASAQSPIGGGRAPSLDTLMQLLNQRYQALYPGGGSSKGLLGV